MSQIFVFLPSLIHISVFQLCFPFQDTPLLWWMLTAEVGHVCRTRFMTGDEANEELASPFYCKRLFRPRGIVGTSTRKCSLHTLVIKQGHHEETNFYSNWVFERRVTVLSCLARIYIRFVEWMLMIRSSVIVGGVMVISQVASLNLTSSNRFSTVKLCLWSKKIDSSHFFLRSAELSVVNSIAISSKWNWVESGSRLLSLCLISFNVRVCLPGDSNRIPFDAICLRAQLSLINDEVLIKFLRVDTLISRLICNRFQSSRSLEISCERKIFVKITCCDGNWLRELD